MFQLIIGAAMGYEALELLDQLRGEEVDWIISNATPLTLLASATLIQDGAPGGYIYFITDGTSVPTLIEKIQLVRIGVG
jgi:hypothetical protein